MKKVLAINGSASDNSSNLSIINFMVNHLKGQMQIEVVEDLSILPSFKTALTDKNTPEVVQEFRKNVERADAILICSPEYVFSIPSGLKNAIEWCVSTTVFSGKPIGIITASASGRKAHEELKLIMSTIETIFNDDTTLLVQGIKGKVSAEGAIIDEKLSKELILFSESFIELIRKSHEQV